MTRQELKEAVGERLSQMYVSHQNATKDLPPGENEKNYSKHVMTLIEKKLNSYVVVAKQNLSRGEEPTNKFQPSS